MVTELCIAEILLPTEYSMAYAALRKATNETQVGICHSHYTDLYPEERVTVKILLG
jgi:hypothetical protein